MTKSKTLPQVAADILREHGPLHYRDLTQKTLASGQVSSSSKTPAATLNSIISGEIKRNGANSKFIRIRPSVFGLRELHANESEPLSTTVVNNEPRDDDMPVENKRVQVPYFPTYSGVRHLLKVWLGRPRKQVTGFRTMLYGMRGTLQNNTDWTNPDEWISERLSGDYQDLAKSIWTESRGTVNPRHTQGHWFLSRTYDLVKDDSNGNLTLTDRGADFLNNDSGEATAFLDEREGLIALLTLVADNGPTRTGGLIKGWTDYLSHYSSYGTPSTSRSTLQYRLSNLLDRGLINRIRAMYSITNTGLAYLERSRAVTTPSGDEQQELRVLARKHTTVFREHIRNQLLELDPYVFEHLIKQLLERMGYVKVEVTKQSNDGGVDVVAEFNDVGFDSIREVFQVKRHKRTIQRSVVATLRGSLHLFDAIRGTIITTSKFSSGAEKEAIGQKGVAPISLVNGDDLINSLIENEFGVRKEPINILTFHPDDFPDLEGKASIENNTETAGQ